MIIDTHLHERTFSPDSKMNLLELVAEARRKGLEGVCITDHDVIGLTKYAGQVAAAENFPIFVGVEYLSCEGDIVAFGIDQLPGSHATAQEFADYVTEQGGVCIAAHPYRSNSRGLGDMLLSVKNIIGAEAYNGSATPAENQQALATCRRAGLKPFGASDAHNTAQVGLFATEIPGRFSTVKELVQAIRTQDCHPVCLSGYRSL